MYSHLISLVTTGMAQVFRIFLVEDTHLFLLHIYVQCPGFWWLGDTRNQGISSHDSDLIVLEYSGISTWRFNLVCRLITSLIKNWFMPVCYAPIIAFQSSHDHHQYPITMVNMHRQRNMQIISPQTMLRNNGCQSYTSAEFLILDYMVPSTHCAL